MTTKKKKIPIGVDDYKKLIDNNSYYIDKTLMLRDIIDDGSEVLLYTRPRRFGKTLNMSMIYYYFNKSDENMSYLFSDKNIWGCEDEYRNEQGKYPVIYLTLKDWKPINWECGYGRIVSDISRIFAKFDYLTKSEFLSETEIKDFENICAEKAPRNKIEASIKFLSELLNIHHKEKVIILIDEYDTLLNEAYSKGFYDDAVGFLRNFMGSALKNNLSLHKGILTGIFKVAKESIFSDLNNFKPYSIISDKYNEYFGFVGDEVAQMLSYYEISEKLDNVAKWYNGYNFGRTKFATLYNPWSILMFVDNKSLGPYWVNTSANQIIKDIVLNGDKSLHEDVEDLMKGKVLEGKPINEFMVYEDIKKGGDTLWSFLLMSGYLKFTKLQIEETDTPYCDLAMPNREILSFYRLMYKNWLSETMPNGSVNSLLKALLNKNVEEFRYIFQKIVLRTLSFNDTANPEPEKFYHAFTLGLFVNLDDKYLVKSNRESGFGRYDVMIIPRDKNKTGIIIEFKTANPLKNETLQEAVKAAMTQIEERKYETEILDMGVTDILKLAIAFSGKDILIESK